MVCGRKFYPKYYDVPSSSTKKRNNHAYRRVSRLRDLDRLLKILEHTLITKDLGTYSDLIGYL